MSQYTPEKLVAISRYQKFFPTLSAEIQNDTYRRNGGHVSCHAGADVCF